MWRYTGCWKSVCHTVMGWMINTLMPDVIPEGLLHIPAALKPRSTALLCLWNKGTQIICMLSQQTVYNFKLIQDNYVIHKGRHLYSKHKGTVCRADVIQPFIISPRRYQNSAKKDLCAHPHRSHLHWFFLTENKNTLHLYCTQNLFSAFICSLSSSGWCLSVRLADLEACQSPLYPYLQLEWWIWQVGAAIPWGEMW